MTDPTRELCELLERFRADYIRGVLPRWTCDYWLTRLQSKGPDGLRVVPVTETEQMRVAGITAIQEHYQRDGGWCGLLAAQEQMKLTWDAMLRAGGERD